MTRLLLKGGRLYDFGPRIDEIGDLLIEDGKIARIGRFSAVPSDALPAGEWREFDHGGIRVINCAGLIVSPGFIDIHVHLREPGGEAKETVETGTRAAVRGGFTFVCAMPNTKPPCATAEVADFVFEAADAAENCRVMPIFSLTTDRRGIETSHFEHAAARGITMFSDDGSDVEDSGVLATAMKELTKYPATLAVHAEDARLSRVASMHEGEASKRMKLNGIPPTSETVAVARAIILAEYYGAALHICHVSAEGSVELIRWAKAKGLPVTAEVTPSHLLLTDEAVERLGSVAKVNPPLRGEKDRRSLVAALADGTIDCIATDHAPHLQDEKRKSLRFAPFGIAGLETCVGLVWKNLVLENKLPLQRFFDALVTRPAHILTANQLPRSEKSLPQLTMRGEEFYGLVKSGLGTLREGAPADVTVFNPESIWTVDPATFATKAKFTPFKGWKAQGRTEYTIVGGKIKHSAI